MKYGKIHTTESYEDGNISKVKKEIEQSVSLEDKNAALALFFECLELMGTKQSYKVVLELHADPFTYKLKRGVKKWQTENRK